MTRARAIGNVLALAFAALTGAIVVFGLVTLPPTIATHFGPDGVAYGSKWTLLLCLLPLALMYGLFAIVERLPTRNARIREPLGAMLAWMKASTIVIFALLALACVQSASGTPSPLFTLSILGVIPVFGVLAYFAGAIARGGQV